MVTPQMGMGPVGMINPMNPMNPIMPFQVLQPGNNSMMGVFPMMQNNLK